MAKLTSAKRNSLSPSTFVFPATRRYPIPDISHARNALARASGKPEEAQVRAAVKRRFPQIDNGTMSKSDMIKKIKRHTKGN